MAKNHERAAHLIAKKLGGDYNSKRSPDVRSREKRVEVKSYAAEIPKAMKQLGGGQKKKYVALPQREQAKAKEKLRGSGIGLMNHKGQITKRARRS